MKGALGYIVEHQEELRMKRMANEQAIPKKAIRGFAALSAEKRREIAGKGGKAAHAQGVAHKWTSQEASEAGKKSSKVNRKRHKEKQ
jgi:uncharacterized protein